MSRWSSFPFRWPFRSSRVAALAIGMLCPVPIPAQTLTDATHAMQVRFPEDSPVRVVKEEWGDSTIAYRGGVMQLDLRTSLTLQNLSDRQIRGITLKVLAQELTPGGKGAVSVPSLAVNPGEQFVVKVDLRLLRPSPAPNAPLVNIGLDGVLFADLRFFGPNELNLRRSLLGWELQARRDRERFRKVLEQQGPDRLREALVASLARVGDMKDHQAQVTRLAKATAQGPELEAQVAALDLPGSPVELKQGLVKIAGDELRQPQLAIANRGSRPIKSIDVGLRLRDATGMEFFAGLTPAPVALGARQTRVVRPTELMEFRGPDGHSLKIVSVSGMVTQVEYEDGDVWVPGAEALREAGSLLPPSAEELRLADLYRRRGLQAVLTDLRKFQ